MKYEKAGSSFKPSSLKRYLVYRIDQGCYTLVFIVRVNSYKNKGDNTRANLNDDE